MSDIYKNFDEMVASVSKETGVAEADVKKVLSASFESTRAYVVQELKKKAEVTGQTELNGGHVSS